MGGERASTIRMRLAGKICAVCGNFVPTPHTPGVRRCIACGGTRRIYMSFMLRDGWHCAFLEADAKTSLPKKLTFQDSAKIIEMVKRAGCKSDLADKQALEHATEIGRSGVWLELTEEQYLKLK